METWISTDKYINIKISESHLNKVLKDFIKTPSKETKAFIEKIHKLIEESSC